jgi:biotin-dependent carboxylase-like uncharacterized protein
VSSSTSPGPTRALLSTRTLLVERPGPLMTVQDLGRPGLAHLGVGRAGAADRSALRRANRLVANREGAAGLEILLGGAAVRAGRQHLVVAVSGAVCPLLLDGRPVPGETVLDLPPGALLELGTATAGLRGYLAVRGGITVPPVLGSRSRDTLAGVGPEPVAAGDLLPIGGSPAAWPSVEQAPVAWAPPDQMVELRAMSGPRADWLDQRSAAAVWSSSWEVTAQGDRVGLRLEGPPLEPAVAFRSRELPSEGLIPGALQVPPGGRPVLFGVDHPVTGGYPVVAVLLAADVDLAGQLRPGQRLRFRRVDAAREAVRVDCGTAWWGW